MRSIIVPSKLLQWETGHFIWQLWTYFLNEAMSKEFRMFVYLQGPLINQCSWPVCANIIYQLMWTECQKAECEAFGEQEARTRRPSAPLPPLRMALSYKWAGMGEEVSLKTGEGPGVKPIPAVARPKEVCLRMRSILGPSLVSSPSFCLISHL